MLHDGWRVEDHARNARRQHARISIETGGGSASYELIDGKPPVFAPTSYGDKNNITAPASSAEHIHVETTEYLVNAESRIEVTATEMGNVVFENSLGLVAATDVYPYSAELFKIEWFTVASPGDGRYVRVWRDGVMVY